MNSTPARFGGGFRLCAMMLGLIVFPHATSAAQNPPPTQVFYIPFSEDAQLTGFDAINSVAGDPLAVFVTFSTVADDTVIYYDHWEDGYETDITNPVQSTTLVFGDGDSSNGYPPGNAADLISAGTVFDLRNFVETGTLGDVIDYDARDKVASFKPISLTKTCFPAGTNTLLAGCVEIFEQGLWGTEYRVPVGEDMPVSSASGNLTYDENCFSYVAVSISAGKDGASVQVDKDNDGSFEESVTLGEGETVYYEGIDTGARILADNPVQAVLFTGTVESNYASRDTMLLPVYRWATDYYAPVTTGAGDGTVTFLYNPGASPITVSYDYRNSDSSYVTGTVNVPAGGNARVAMSEGNGSTHFGAYRFYTTGANPEEFYAISTIDADASDGNNQAWDGGFTLVGYPSLTTQALVSLGIGRDPYSAVNPTENGNPVWMTTVGNGDTPARVYVDYNGDNSGALTDPNGNFYDVHYDVRELVQLKLFDPDGDQSGMLIYTLDPSVRVAAVWGQDPDIAQGGQPGLDVAALVPPLREGAAGKQARIGDDVDGDGQMSTGDVLEYRIRAVNTARTSIPGPFTVTDNLPAEVDYVPGSTRYRFMVGGAWLDWVSVPDDGSGTAFPLDGSGYAVVGAVEVGGEIEVSFEATVSLAPAGDSLVNTGTVEISPYGLVIPIESEDVLYGTLGDRVWNDIDGDGVQDGGEPGINGITVFADLDDDGVQDADEPSAVTNGDGDYRITGLTSGTYVVRVDPGDIAAIDPRFGPSGDLDGTLTPHEATAALGPAEDRTDVDFGYKIGASVGDRVWADFDGDGVQEAGEPGINGVRVYLDLNGNNSFDSGEPFSITFGDGDYFIGNLDPGTYEVRVDTGTLPGAATQTHDLNGALDHEGSVSLSGVEHRDDLDFGYRGSLSIGDLVWEDINADGIASSGYDIIDGRIDINGDGFVSGSDDGFAAGYDIIDGGVDITGNGSISNFDDGSIAGFTVINGEIDANGNGSVSGADDLDDAIAGGSAESGIAGVRVYLDANGNGQFDSNEASDVTDSIGNYSIGNLFNGAYLVRVDESTLPASYVQTYDLTDPVDDSTAEITLSGASRDDVDFGYRNDATLGDLVWNDRDGDGVRDAGEPGIEGVLVYIDADGDNRFDQGVETLTYTDIDGYYVFENLADGTYQVRVEISTLPQGSTQTYDLTGGLDHEASRTLAVSEDATDVDFGYRASASFGDFVWSDTDGDGVQDGGEPGISGVTVYADINGNGVFDAATEPSAVTDGSGAYTIGNLVPGTYTARVDPSSLPAGVVQTYDLAGALDHAATFSLSATQARTDVDFGYAPGATIGDFVWEDTDGDGVQDGGEPGLAGVGVTLYRASDDAIVATTTTAGDGSYEFAGLAPGTYYLVFAAVGGYERTAVDQGADTADSDAALATGRTANVTVVGGETNSTLDAGYYQPGSIGDFVWEDTDGNGVQDGGEPGLGAVSVDLFRPGFGPDGIPGNTDDDDAVATTVSGGDGSYVFAGLVPGDYVVVFGDVTDYERSPEGEGTAATDSDADTDGSSSPVTVASGQDVDDIDAGYFPVGSISGSVLADLDGNGTGDAGIGGVTIRLLDSSGNPVLDESSNPITTLTAGDGSYSFDDLPLGDYRISQDQPSGYLSVSDTDGPNDNLIGDVTPVTVTAGADNGGNDFIEIQPGSISGTVRVDIDNDDLPEQPLAGVTVTLQDASGNDIDSDPGTPGVQPTTDVTDVNGDYGFGGLLPGNYQVVESDPAGYASVSDIDGANNNVIGDETPISVTAGAANTGNDFVDEQLCTISGTVLADTDGNGSGDAGIENVVVTLTDAAGNPIDGDTVTPGVQPVTTTTDSNGDYVFPNVLPGDYGVSESQPAGYASVADGDRTTPSDDAANVDTGDDFIPVSVLNGESDDGNDFIEVEYGSIAGTVLADTDDNGTGDAPLENVELALLDGLGNPVLDGGNPVTTTTDASGNYRFDDLLPGDYQVAETQPSGYGSVSDVDGGDPDLIGNVVSISVSPGEDVTGRDFVEIELGAISGHVFVGTDPLAGVTLTLLDEFGDPFDGDPGTPGVQPITTVTGADGSYRFDDVPPGVYQVGQTQPEGYDSFGDIDGGDLDIIGDVSPISLAPGEESEDNDFVETLDTCPDDWDEWLFQHPGEWADGNPDLDAYDNLAEFAFAMPADDGSGSPWLDRSAWIIQPSSLAPGTIEGVFIRPTGALLDVTYTLEYAASLGDPVVWQSLTLEPSHYSTVNNGDCTETVTIHDLENLTGLTGGDGVVRLRVDLDEEPDSTIDHTSYAEVEGWTEADLPLCCVTYNDPYQRETLFTGTVGAVDGQDLEFTVSSGSFDLDDLLEPGASYYVEVNSGDLEGHRFDVASASGNTLTLVNDSDLHAAAAPFNTLTGAPPAALVGDSVMLRRHTTLAEHFPPSSFGATGSQTTADEVQVFAEGGWTSYWLFDDGGSPRWVEMSDATLADQGSVVIPPGQGVFFYNRTLATTVLQYGEIRDNDFVRPLMDGDNLVGGGYPLDQSATGLNGRAMDAGFTGTLDFKTADSFYLWRKDGEGPTARGYHSHFRVDGSPYNPSLVRWAEIGDSVLTDRGDALLFLKSHAVFVRSQAGFDAYTMPLPWSLGGP